MDLFLIDFSKCPTSNFSTRQIRDLIKESNENRGILYFGTSCNKISTHKKNCRISFYSGIDEELIT